MARFPQEADRVLVIVQVEEKQFGQVHIVIRLGGVDEEALLVIRGRFGILGLGFVRLFFLHERFGIFLQHSPQQLVGLILLRMLLDDFLQHLDRLAALVGQDETGSEFFARVRVVRLEFQHAQIERDRLLYLLRGGEIIRRIPQDRGVARRQRERLAKDGVHFFQLFGLGILVRLGDEREVELAELGPERGIVGLDLGRAIERLQRALAIAGRQLHLGEALVTLNLVRRERHRLFRITNRRLHFLEILGVNVGELEIGAGLFRLGLDRVLQDIDRARIIPLLGEQKSDPRGEIDFAGIDVQDPLESREGFLAFAVFLKVECLDVISRARALRSPSGCSARSFGGCRTSESSCPIFRQRGRRRGLRLGGLLDSPGEPRAKQAGGRQTGRGFGRPAFPSRHW